MVFSFPLKCQVGRLGFRDLELKLKVGGSAAFKREHLD
jgi:hypothetical protein